MKKFIFIATFLLVFLASGADFTTARLHNDRPMQGSSTSSNQFSTRCSSISMNDTERRPIDVRMAADTPQAAGSRLPDCSHACGSCSPCRLVMVGSDNASSIAQAESYPVSYRCMCNNKTYPIP